MTVGGVLPTRAAGPCPGRQRGAGPGGRSHVRLAKLAASRGLDGRRTRDRC
jgi:hypothetical protein